MTTFKTTCKLKTETDWLIGIGLHTGKDSRIRIIPGEPGKGIVFRNVVTGAVIPARLECVTNTVRCTELGFGGHAVSTVEHVLSALRGLDIYDATVEFSGEEMPIADGSSQPFVRLLELAGLEPTDSSVVSIPVEKCIFLEGASGASIFALPHSRLEICVILDYPKVPFIGSQSFEYVEGDNYKELISPARTYGFLSEIEWLRNNGLARGATLENVVAIDSESYATDLRFPDELVRHKMLDVIGDMSLLGAPLMAKIVAVKPSHSLNINLARLINEAAHERC